MILTGAFYSGTFWGAIADDIKAVETPTGFQGKIREHTASFFTNFIHRLVIQLQQQVLFHGSSFQQLPLRCTSTLQ